MNITMILLALKLVLVLVSTYYSARMLDVVLDKATRIAPTSAKSESDFTKPLACCVSMLCAVFCVSLIIF